jgi:aminomethyltransferase
MSLSRESLRRTPLHELHEEQGARFVPFAGYAMPVQYPAGVLSEHLHTRRAAGLFDVSHMGQLRLTGADPARSLERLVPGDILGLGLGRTRYTLLLNEAGGILDDLMVTNRGDHLFAVVNAATKAADIAHLQASLAGEIHVEWLEDRALLALQGPAAALVLSRLAPALTALPFMSCTETAIDGIAVLATRCGYTGEDGFELSVAAEDAVRLARRLLAEPEVAPIGLGARDSLRLEAGLCLYGHDIDTATTPVEADLAWTIGKRRRRDGGFPGAEIVQRQLEAGPSRKRVGILPDGKAPAREHTEIRAGDGTIGTITSGGFGPSAGTPISMGYVATEFAAAGTPIELIVRGTPRPARIARLPFTPHRYYSGDRA